MRLVSFVKQDGVSSFGLLEGDEVIDLASEVASTLKQALSNGLDRLPSSGARHSLSSVSLLPPITDPGKVLCVGLNYATHVAETGREQLPYPAIFTRWADTLVADGQPIVRPTCSDKLDFEGELAIVIGIGGRYISASAAMNHVAGFAPFNDGSVRDWQRHNSQFTPGKNFPATGSFGPALVTQDEVEDLGSQRVQTRLNGELVQDQPVSDMLWDIPSIIEYVSTFTPLMPGDVIATGTPGGVGSMRKPPLFMKPGDMVEVSIGMIGKLSNRIVVEGGT